MNADTVAEAAAVIRDGGVVAYPTEAVFGLGCDPRQQQAVARILELKGREAAEGLVLIAATVAQLEPFIQALAPEVAERVLATWPGPVTWAVPAGDGTPAWIRGRHATVAVRVTAHPVAAQLCEAAGTALVSTSANLHGYAPARTADGVRAVFGTRVDAVVAGQCGGLDRPTTIRDAISGAVLRPA